MKYERYIRNRDHELNFRLYFYLKTISKGSYVHKNILSFSPFELQLGLLFN